MSSDIYSDQAISTSTHTLSLCKYVAHCMLNTRWPGDGPPLKRLFGTKLKTVYLKKQVYNSARWIAGSGWRGRGDGDAGTLAVLRACGPPGGGTAAARAAFSLPGPAAAGGGSGRHTRRSRRGRRTPHTRDARSDARDARDARGAGTGVWGVPSHSSAGGA